MLINTLKELHEEYSKRNAYRMLAAVKEAIKDHGENAKAVIVYGTCSKAPQSNIGIKMKLLKVEKYDIYPGAKRRYATQGYCNVVVIID